MATFVNNKYLTKFVIDNEPEGFKFISDELFTEVPVTQIAGTYKNWARHSSKLINTEAAIRAEANRQEQIRAITDGTYAIQNERVKDIAVNAEADTLKDWVNLQKDILLGLKKGFQIVKEYNTHELAMNGISGASGTYHFTPTIKWDATNATVEADIRLAIKTFENNALISPNVLVIPKQVWDSIIMDATLRNVFLLVPSRRDQNVKLSSLMQLLFDNFDKILIPNSKYDTAAKGVTESMDWIWESDSKSSVELFYVKPGKGTKRTFTWASKFKKTDLKVKQWASEDPDGTWIRLERNEQIKQVCPTARYVIYDVLT